MVLSIAAGLTAARAANLAEEAPGEYQVKAAFLYNFARFVAWPAESFRSAAEPFYVCVLGEDPFGSLLEETLAGKTVDTHPFAIRRVGDIRDVQSCQILFIGQKTRAKVLEALGRLQGMSVLTVGETDGFATYGGVMGLNLQENHRVRVEVNLESARRAKLQISSRLLSLAIIVKR